MQITGMLQFNIDRKLFLGEQGQINRPGLSLIKDNIYIAGNKSAIFF